LIREQGDAPSPAPVKEAEEIRNVMRIDDCDTSHRIASNMPNYVICSLMCSAISDDALRRLHILEDEPRELLNGSIPQLQVTGA